MDTLVIVILVLLSVGGGEWGILVGAGSGRRFHLICGKAL